MTQVFVLREQIRNSKLSIAHLVKLLVAEPAHSHQPVMGARIFLDLALFFPMVGECSLRLFFIGVETLLVVQMVMEMSEFVSPKILI